MARNHLIGAFLLLTTIPVFSQQVDILRIERDGDNVILNYNLVDEVVERRYSLFLYTSADNYINPLASVKGDIGIDLSVGNNKRITWNAKEEFGADYTGAVALELKGQVYIPFIKLEGISDYESFKRTVPYDLTWTGGRGDNILLFELYKGDKKVKVFEERPNIGNTKLVIPQDVPPGKGYRFKISDKGNRDEVVFSGVFNIKRKISLGLKVGAGALVTGGTVFLINALTESIIPIPKGPGE